MIQNERDSDTYIHMCRWVEGKVEESRGKRTEEKEREKWVRTKTRQWVVIALNKLNKETSHKWQGKE